MSSPLAHTLEIQWLQQMRDDFDRRLSEAQGRYHEGQKPVIGAGPHSIMESLPQYSALSLPADTTQSQMQSLTIPLTPTSPATTVSLLETPFPQVLATSPAESSSTRNRRSSDIFSDFRHSAPSERPLSDAVVERIEITYPQASDPSVPIPSQVKITDLEMATLMGIPLKDSRETALAIMASNLTWEEKLNLAWGIGQAVNAGSIPRFVTGSKPPAVQHREEIGASDEKAMNQGSTGVALKPTEVGDTSNFSANGKNPFLSKEREELKHEEKQETVTSRGSSMMPLNTHRAFQDIFTKTTTEIQYKLRTDNQEPEVVLVPEYSPRILGNDEQESGCIQAKGKENANTEQKESNIMLSAAEKSQMQRPCRDVNGKSKATTATSTQGGFINMLSIPSKEQNELESAEEVQMERLSESIQNESKEEEKQFKTSDSQDSENVQTGRDIERVKITNIADEKTIPVDTTYLETGPSENSGIEIQSPCWSRTPSPVLQNSGGKGLFLPCDSATKPSINDTGALLGAPFLQLAVPSINRTTVQPQCGSKSSEQSSPIHATAFVNENTGFKRQNRLSSSGGLTLPQMNKTQNDHNRAHVQSMEWGSENPPLTLSTEILHATAQVDIQFAEQSGSAPPPCHARHVPRDLTEVNCQHLGLASGSSSPVHTLEPPLTVAAAQCSTDDILIKGHINVTESKPPALEYTGRPDNQQRTQDTDRWLSLYTIPENRAYNNHAASRDNSPTQYNIQAECTGTSSTNTSGFYRNPVGYKQTSCANESATVCSKPGDRRATRPFNGRFAARSLRDCLRRNTVTNSPTRSSPEPADGDLPSQSLSSEHLATARPSFIEIATLEQLFQSSTDASEPEKPLIRIPHSPAAQVAVSTVTGADVTPNSIIPWESRALREAPPHIRAKARLGRGRYVDILGTRVNVCAGLPVPQVPGVAWYFAQTRL